MEKRPFFRAATAGLGKYHMGGYSRIGVYRVNSKYDFTISHFTSLHLSVAESLRGRRLSLAT